jgi:NitT/TauT family transport system substrate-binding protein
VRPDKGVRTFADLKGKPIATTKKTTAHIFLSRALRANGIDSGRGRGAQQQHVRGGRSLYFRRGPAVALWVPFNVQVREKPPEAIKLVDASAFYPQSAVVGGWVARADYHDDNKEVLVRIIRGWAEANDYMVRNSAAAAEALHQNHYPHASAADISEAFKAQKMYSSREWKRLYSDGTVGRWLQQVSDFFMADAGVAKSVMSTEYFDPSLYLLTI